MSEALKRDYDVGEEIGRGRFGVVFRCVSRDSGHPFACKSIDKHLISDDSVDRQCLYNEPKIMQLVAGNPNIVQILDTYEDEAYLHMVVELCEPPRSLRSDHGQGVFRARSGSRHGPVDAGRGSLPPPWRGSPRHQAR
ncbi:hypothetical protein L1049_016772 [Liquidambar formosana]|uniref:Protein kinase domain-containing protein n=1 Tax=Liquidambar formosana TaxID=63359 RepID=A0AAP0RZR8_LIQFO